MKNWHDHSTEALCDAFACLHSREECLAFLEDICTIKEILDMSQRLEVARLLRAGTSYAAITRATGASTATISRVSKCCEYGTGGYRTVIDRLSGEENP